MKFKTSPENTKEKTDMSDQTKALAEKVAELMAAGKTLEEALKEAGAMTSTGGARSGIDRIALAKETNNLALLRKSLKTAYAKKSKAGKGTEAETRYISEVKAIQDRINELMAEIAKAPNRLEKAVELGEEPSGVIAILLEMLEPDVKARLGALPGTENIKKALVQNEKAIVPEDIKAQLLALGKNYLDSFQERINKDDQRVVSLVKRLNFLTNAVKKPAGGEQTKEQTVPPTPSGEADRVVQNTKVPDLNKKADAKTDGKK